MAKDGIMTFLAVLGVIFLFWLGANVGTMLCEAGVTCDRTQPNPQEDTQETSPIMNETTNSTSNTIRSNK